MFSTQGNLTRHLLDQHAELKFWYKMPCNKVLKYNVFNGKRHMGKCLPCQKVQPPAAIDSQQTLLLSTEEPFRANAEETLSLNTEEMFSFDIEQMPWLNTNEALSFNTDEPLPINTNEALSLKTDAALPTNTEKMLWLIIDGAPWKPKVFVAHSQLTKNDVEYILN
ncbi:hypothetical protein CTAM01_01781 [Colletotrichum tamarilloi]|uniref:Uncharacterized protein n=1 Tax=Colletotrichum tamarilloi TaxID=1209934 RepID=A0ABQ9RPI3_9PEZI|nr:uncharacterized protein CTAM01_01781 [Colletotrichum tamarilloi]KAK1509658.1 hypothetical protein CTAM01_01781 [Colletotrichum tamarilloi]